MISVILTVHPPLLPHLQRCVDSVMWQLGEFDQLILVGDNCGPYDDYISGRYSGTSPDIICPVSRRNAVSGVSAARNLGLQHASGEWVKFLDADDLLAPFALNIFRAAVGTLPPEVAVLAGAQVKVHNGIPRGTIDPPDIDNVITRANPLLVSMAFVRRAAANAVLGFNEQIDFEEDWEFWLKLRAAKHRFARMSQPFCYYWVDDAERAGKQRTHQIEGMDVRAWLAKTYGVTPV